MPPTLAWPVWCTELELGGQLPDVLVPPDGTAFRSVRVLLRLHGDPLGYICTGPGAALRTAELIALAGADVVTRAREHLRSEQAPAEVLPSGVGDLARGFPLPEPGCPARADTGPLVTVAVCTRDRGEALRTCLESLRRLRYPDLDVLVVDNAPTSTATRDAFDACVGDDGRFRYTVEPRPGLSRARNRALAEALGELIAYTDDDVEVDAGWVDGLVRAFARGPEIGCVTGLVGTASVDGPAEAYFDARASWGHSCTPRVFSLAADERDGLFPYSPGVFGTGANVAFRTGLLRHLGGFDEALGAGTIAAGGEDLDAFVRVVNAGHSLAYAPGALVWHHHRGDLDGLGRQLFAYGTGLSAFLTKHLLDPVTRREVLRRVPAGARRLVRIPATTSGALGRSDAEGHVPPSRARALLAREFAGMLAGPVLYLRSRRKVA